MQADLSVIIVCYKGWNRLRKCLESIEKFRGNYFIAEVIVVDNSSDDEIDRIKERFPEFTFIQNARNGGFGNGCNLGAQNASAEFLLFLNPDTVVSEDGIGKLLESAVQNPQFSILSCRQVNENGKESIACGTFPSISNLTGLQRAIFKPRPPRVLPYLPEILFPDWVSGSVIMTRKSTFLDLNGFDEEFWMYYEDVDICKRTRMTGGEIAFMKNITIEHNHGGSSRINLKTTSLTKTEVHISQHLYISKHLKGSEKFLAQVFLVFNNLLSGGIMAITGILLFFLPKLFSRSVIFSKLIVYYVNSIIRHSWVSPRSVKSMKN